MKIVDNIKLKIAYFLLKRKLKDFFREKSFNNFESAKTVGLICNAQNQKTYDFAKQFAVYLTSYDIQVSAIGFIEGDAVLDAFSYQKGFTFIAKKDFNWLGVPQGEILDSFLAKRFDILINLVIEDSYTVDYIASLSLAKFKVGRLSENDYYDLTIDISMNNRLDFFISQVKHYLSVIKK